MDVHTTEALQPSAYTVDALYKQYDEYVLRLAWLFGAPQVADAMDVAQAVWTWVIEHPEDVECDERRVHVWLAHVTRARWTAVRRRRDRQGTPKPDAFFEECSGSTDSFFDVPPGSTRAPDLQTDEEQLWEGVRRWIGNADYFQTFVLRAVYRWPLQDIAEFQGVSEETIKKRLERVRVRLSEKLKKDRAFLPILSIEDLVERLRQEPVLPPEHLPVWRERMRRTFQAPPRPGKPPVPKSAPWALSVTAVLLTVVAGPVRGPSAAPAFEIYKDSTVTPLQEPVVRAPIVPASAAPRMTSTVRRLAVPPSVPRSNLSNLSDSKLLLLRMAAARRARNLALVLQLADLHERLYPQEDAGAREHERARARQ